MVFYYEAFDHVQLAMPKNSESIGRDFFVGVLGFKEVVKPEQLRANGGAWFKAGNVHIHLGVEEPFAPAKKAHPAIRVKGIQSLINHLLDSNIKVTIDTHIPSAKRFYITDPFGNRLEFIEWLE